MPVGEQFRPFFPGLIPVETAIWRVWLREHETEFDGFEYNVRVGEGIRPPPIPAEANPEQWRRLEGNWKALTQKRIDVVAARAGERWLIEIEERLSTRALGQLMLYADLYPQETAWTGPITLAMVVVRVGQDMLGTVERQGILVYKVASQAIFQPFR